MKQLRYFIVHWNDYSIVSYLALNVFNFKQSRANFSHNEPKLNHSTQKNLTIENEILPC